MTQQAAQSLHNFPAQPTSFIGRAAELAQISETLAEPDCGLLTLVGSGGVGKSRLAIQVAIEVAAEFSDGLYFVPLQSISSSDGLLTAITEGVNFSPQGQETPRQQLLTHLHDKELLLVLDNFAQLLPHSTPDATNGGEQSLTLLSNILATAPAVTLLVTSREVLNLQGEWLFPLRGLAFPRIDQANDIEGYAAVQLFVERARQVRPAFSLAEEQAGVVRICRLVAGIPLALELAASWVKNLRCEAIAAEVEQNLEFLATRLRDVPERHRSLQAVFDHSWALLTETERAVFKQLSVFRGSFRHTAASQIAGATLPVLSALVDKSLLRWEPETQYQLHELLRQYAAERLQETPEAAVQVRRRHCAYYANFLHERFEDVLGGRQKEAAAEIELELDNVRLAWQWAVEQVEVEHIQKAAQTLSLVYQFQSRYLEGARAFEAAAERLTSAASEPDSEQIDLTLVLILIDRAWFYIRLGWLDQAKAVVARCRTIYERLDRPPVAGHGTDPLLALGVIASIRGDYETAARLGEKVRQVSEAHDHLWNRQIAYYLLAQTRESELRAAAEVLGLHEISLLDYVDGELDRADLAEAVAKIVAQLRRIRPQVVVTFDPYGSYGHPDHIAICQFTSAAVVAAADSTYENGEPPHRVSKLYYFVETREILDTYEAAFGELVMQVDGQERRAPGWAPWAITTRIDTEAYWQQVWEAIACHRSQLPGNEALRQLPAAEQKKLWGCQSFYRALSLVNGGRAVEDDLFAGVR